MSLHKLIVTMLFIIIAGCKASDPIVTPVGTTPQLPTPSLTPSHPKSTATTRSATSTPEIATPEPSPYAAVVEALDGLTIEFWHIWTGETAVVLNAMVQEFNRSNPYGIQARGISYSGYNDLYYAVNDAIRDDNLPDLIIGLNTHFLEWDHDADLFINLTPYLVDTEFGLGAQEEMDISPVFLEQDQDGEKQIALPLLRSLHGIFYNITWAKELGYTAPPTTPAELKEQACQAAIANNTDSIRGNDGTGGWMITQDPNPTLGWLYAFEAEVHTPTGYLFETPDVEEAFYFMKELYQEGCAWQPPTRFPNPEFSIRQGLFYASSISGIPFQQSAFLDNNNADEWTVIGFPTKTGDWVVPAYGPSGAIVVSSPEKQLAGWLLLQHLIHAPQQNRWAKATGFVPVNLAAIQNAEGTGSQWDAVLALTNSAIAEPPLPSWRTVRAVLTDAANIWFSDFPKENLSFLLAELQNSAEEIHALESP